MEFRFYRLRFRMEARAPIHFPVGKPANILRGAFGSIFRSLACDPGCPGAKTCAIRSRCAYARTFEPAATSAGPSGLADWPRPFVFRAAHLDGRTISPGEAFHFDMNLFETREPPFVFLTSTFAQLATAGLGPGRGLARLVGVEQTDTALSLLPVTGSPDRVRVRFCTPTELKAGAELAALPEFPILMARTRDRISSLSALYGAGPLGLDFAEFGRRAQQVKLTGHTLAPVHVKRLSTRTGQTHSLGGFVGVADYEGDLAEFLPFLEAARFTGVGRQTTWGKGEIALESSSSGP